MSETLRLIDAAQAGDRAAFDALFARHRGRLTAFAASRMSPALRTFVDPEDVVQETHIEAARKLDGFEAQGPHAFYRWLVTIAGFKIREANKRRQARKRGQPAALEVEPAAVQTSVSGRVGRVERTEQVARAIDALPEGQAEAVRLRYLEGLSIHETAQRLDRSPAAIKALVARGLAALASGLEPSESP